MKKAFCTICATELSKTYSNTAYCKSCKKTVRTTSLETLLKNGCEGMSPAELLVKLYPVIVEYQCSSDTVELRKCIAKRNGSQVGLNLCKQVKKILEGKLQVYNKNKELFEKEFKKTKEELKNCEKKMSILQSVIQKLDEKSVELEEKIKKAQSWKLSAEGLTGPTTMKVE